tara:strand:+ start:173 stop:574 length:402 start_codon:yes stop_codon:yes gene_type:complete
MITYQQVAHLITFEPEILDEVKYRYRKQFIEWFPLNMHVIEAFERYAIELKRNGNREYYSIKAILERLRWDSMLEDSALDYKLNNNHAACISRILMRLNPELDGMFQLRSQVKPRNEVEDARDEEEEYAVAAI